MPRAVLQGNRINPRLAPLNFITLDFIFLSFIFDHTIFHKLILRYRKLFLIFQRRIFQKYTPLTIFIFIFGK